MEIKILFEAMARKSGIDTESLENGGTEYIQEYLCK